MELWEIAIIEKWLEQELQVVEQYKQHCLDGSNATKVPSGMWRVNWYRACIMHDHINNQLGRLYQMRQETD